MSGAGGAQPGPPRGADLATGDGRSEPARVTEPARVLVIGGTGVFGARLAAGLRLTPGVRVLVAGRSAQADVVLHRGAPDLAARLAASRPAIVIDAGGPFQPPAGPPPDVPPGEPSDAVARAAIACGPHHLDLPDDAAFTAGIGALDGAARTAGVAVISGIASVPALSSAAVEELRAGLIGIHLIESAILPGNRAPRGLAVMRAILAQADRPLDIWRAGRDARAGGGPGAGRCRAPRRDAAGRGRRRPGNPRAARPGNGGHAALGPRGTGGAGLPGRGHGHRDTGGGDGSGALRHARGSAHRPALRAGARPRARRFARPGPRPSRRPACAPLDRDGARRPRRRPPRPGDLRAGGLPAPGAGPSRSR